MLYYIGIDDEDSHGEYMTYLGLKISVDGKEIIDFKSGDFIKDWFHCMVYLNSKAIDGYFPMVTQTSQLNHLSDYNFNFESAYLHISDKNVFFKYLDRSKNYWWEDNDGITDGIEFFVPDNTWTYEQLVDYCK